jgi:hypothetical protein
MTPEQIRSTNWFSLLEPDQQRSVLLSLETDFSDYSFVLFPISKTYEGFLKKFLFTMGLITQEVYEGRNFRIGRALNPDISRSQRDQWWLYDNVEAACGPDLARKLWQAWLQCRNHVFHYFPGSPNELSLQQVEQKFYLLIDLFELAWQCQVRKHRS